MFLVDWLPWPLGKLQSFPLFVFQFTVSVSLFTFHFFFDQLVPLQKGWGGGRGSQQNILYACMQMSSISGRFRRHYRGACAQKKARGDRQKNCQLSKLYKMNVTKIENLCAATGQDRRGQKWRGVERTDRQSCLGWWWKVSTRSIRTVVPVRELLFSFSHFYGTCKSPAEQALSIQISPGNLSDNESIGLKTLTRFAYISLVSSLPPCSRRWTHREFCQLQVSSFIC